MNTDKSKFYQGQFNLYTADNIPDTHRDFYEKQQRNLPEDTINPTIPEFIRDEALVLYETKQDTNYKGEVTYSLETHPIIALISENGTICRLRKDFSTGRYRFYPWHNHYSGAHHISHHKRNEALKEIDEPNKIGVWNERKVNDWLDYCDKYVEIIQELVDQYETTHMEHLTYVQDFIDHLPDCEVQRNNNKTYVYTDLFDITFTHEKGVSYLREDIDFKGSLTDVTAIEKSLS